MLFVRPVGASAAVPVRRSSRRRGAWGVHGSLWSAPSPAGWSDRSAPHGAPALPGPALPGSPGDPACGGGGGQPHGGGGGAVPFEPVVAFAVVSDPGIGGGGAQGHPGGGVALGVAVVFPIACGGGGHTQPGGGALGLVPFAVPFGGGQEHGGGGCVPFVVVLLAVRFASLPRAVQLTGPRLATDDTRFTELAPARPAAIAGNTASVAATPITAITHILRPIVRVMVVPSGNGTARGGDAGFPRTYRNRSENTPWSGAKPPRA